MLFGPYASSSVGVGRSRRQSNQVSQKPQSRQEQKRQPGDEKKPYIKQQLDQGRTRWRWAKKRSTANPCTRR